MKPCHSLRVTGLTGSTNTRVEAYIFECCSRDIGRHDVPSAIVFALQNTYDHNRLKHINTAIAVQIIAKETNTFSAF